jgi:hypothetical protein
MNDNKKNEWVAAIASFFIAGWGQVYNGESWIEGGSFFFGRIVGIFILLIVNNTGIFVTFFNFFSLFPEIIQLGIFITIFFILPWILVALYDTYIAFSTARKMNAGEIPFRETKGIFFWSYPIIIIIWTILFWIVAFSVSPGLGLA